MNLVFKLPRHFVVPAIAIAASLVVLTVIPRILIGEIPPISPESNRPISSPINNVDQVTNSERLGALTLEQVWRSPIVDPQRMTVLDLTKAGARARVDDADSLDPTFGNNFIVSFLVRFERLPDVTRRAVVMQKIGPAPANSGWAIAVRRYPTSMRPEVYWRDSFGKGGWFSFDEVAFAPRRWYRITWVAEVSSFMRMLIEPLPENGESIDDSTDASRRARYLGGYDLTHIATVESPSPLILGNLSSKKSLFRGQLGSLLIVSTRTDAGTVQELEAELTKGRGRLLQSIKVSDLAFWLLPVGNQSGRDRSQFTRPLELSSGATWQKVQ